MIMIYVVINTFLKKCDLEYVILAIYKSILDVQMYYGRVREDFTEGILKNTIQVNFSKDYKSNS